MTPQETKISVIDPLSPAIERVKTVLFQPFVLRRWFVIGFCAWLAFLGSGGGSGPNFNFNIGGQHYETSGDSFHHVKEFFIENLYWILPLAITIFLVFIIIGFVMAWLSSRGHFMFLHCVALNKAEIKVPWSKFSKQGNSFFLFRIVLGVISFAVIMLLVAMLTVIGILLFAGGGGPNPLGVILMILLGLFLIIPIAIFFALIGKFTRDFVVPVMFLRQGTCMAAWREFWPLLTGNKGKFTVYILFQILLFLAVSIIGASVACLFLLLLVCVTCGIACCFLGIPLLNIPFALVVGYLVTVLLLPLSVFGRSYSLLYLRQYGTEYDVFGPGPAEIQAA